MEKVDPPFTEMPAFGPQAPVDIKAFTRGEFSYSNVRSSASGSNEVGTGGGSGVSVGGGGGGGGGSDNTGYLESAIQELASAINDLGQGISELQERINNAQVVADCDGDGNITIDLAI